MKYIAIRTISIRDPHTGRVDGVTKGELVSEARAKKFRLENFSPASRGRGADSYTLAEAKLLAELYLELNGNLKAITEKFIELTSSSPTRAGSVECMVRRIQGTDTTRGTDSGLPLESHKDFGKVYSELLQAAPSPTRFL